MAEPCTTGTWYPPSAGTGQLLCNPPFSAMADTDHQDLIETACHNACQAMHAECTRAIDHGGAPQTCLVLAAALEAMTREGVTGDDLPACIDRLRRSAAPRRDHP